MEELTQEQFNELKERVISRIAIQKLTTDHNEQDKALVDEKFVDTLLRFILDNLSINYPGSNRIRTVKVVTKSGEESVYDLPGGFEHLLLQHKFDIYDICKIIDGDTPFTSTKNPGNWKLKEYLGQYIILTEKDNTGDKFEGITFSDGITSAWWDTENLEFISKGSSAIVNEIKKKADEIRNKENDLKYIKLIWSSGNISSTTILFLMDKIGFESSYHNTVEYAILFTEFTRLRSIFDTVFEESSTLEDAISMAKMFNYTSSKQIDIDKLQRLYEEVNNDQTNSK